MAELQSPCMLLSRKRLVEGATIVIVHLNLGPTNLGSTKTRRLKIKQKKQRQFLIIGCPFANINASLEGFHAQRMVWSC